VRGAVGFARAARSEKGHCRPTRTSMVNDIKD
jgi:hypothetical protein